MSVPPASGDPFGFTPDPTQPGWLRRDPSAEGKFFDSFGTVRLRIEDDGRVRCRFQAGPAHRNIHDAVHGGYAMAIVDQVLFIAPAAKGIAGAVGGATVDVGVQFFGPLIIAPPIDAVVEVLRETRRLIFMRGLIEQEGTAAVAFSGTIRKAGNSR